MGTEIHEQGSPEWLEARLGKVTASRFADVMTQPRSKAAREAGGISETAKGYLWELVAEALWLKHRQSEDPPMTLPKHLRCLWGPPSIGSNLAMEWGSFWEDEAIKVFGYYQSVDVERTGLVLHPDYPLVGGSPDGLVEEEEILEVKCLGSKRHAEILFTKQMPGDYTAQVQGNLWCTGRKMAHFISYDPRLQLLHRPKGKDVLLAMAVIDVPRDEEYIARLGERTEAFLAFYTDTLSHLGITLEELIGG